jgi:phosphatidylserine/phosphatidylglycerophosphate/cardiolipin synthase-like enzyme
MYTHAINTAKERIWIASPYFAPDEDHGRASTRRYAGRGLHVLRRRHEGGHEANR